MSKLFSYMSAQQVNIIMRSIRGSQKMSDGSVVRGNVVIEGYLLDEDDKFYYLGDNTEAVTDCLDKQDVIRVTSNSENYEAFVVESDDGTAH